MLPDEIQELLAKFIFIVVAFGMLFVSKVNSNEISNKIFTNIELGISIAHCKY